MNVNGHGVPDGDEGGWRTCPTRVVPGPPLISHQIKVAVCLKRQREYFHKCWTCAFSNRRVDLLAKPANGVDRAAVNGARNGHALNGHARNGAAVASNGAAPARTPV